MKKLLKYMRIETAVIYWFLVLGVAVFLSYSDRNNYKEQCDIVAGVVVEKVPTSSVKGSRPLVQYVTGSDTNYFAARGSLRLSVGDAVNVIYNKENPKEAQRYNTWYWINFPLVIKVVLIALGPFILIWGLSAMFKTKTVILSSNRPL